jgi:hypothetical protein
MNVMLDEGGIRSAIHSDPDKCTEVWWGKRLAAVRVDLRRVDADTLRTLLTDGWEGKAPKRLLRHVRVNTSLPKVPGSGEPA